MQKMKNSEVKKLSAFHEQLSRVNENLPIKVWYALSKNDKALKEHERAIEDARLKLVEKYGEKDENGNLKVSESKFVEFQKEFIDILDEEVSVNLHKIDLSYLENTMEKMKGVEGIYLFFNYIVREDN